MGDLRGRALGLRHALLHGRYEAHRYLHGHCSPQARHRCTQCLSFQTAALPRASRTSARPVIKCLSVSCVRVCVRVCAHMCVRCSGDDNNRGRSLQRKGRLRAPEEAPPTFGIRKDFPGEVTSRGARPAQGADAHPQRSPAVGGSILTLQMEQGGTERLRNWPQATQQARGTAGASVRSISGLITAIYTVCIKAERPEDGTIGTTGCYDAHCGSKLT